MSEHPGFLPVESITIYNEITAVMRIRNVPVRIMVDPSAAALLAILGGLTEVFPFGPPSGVGGVKFYEAPESVPDPWAAETS